MKLYKIISRDVDVLLTRRLDNPDLYVIKINEEILIAYIGDHEVIDINVTMQVRNKHRTFKVIDVTNAFSKNHGVNLSYDYGRGYNYCTYDSEDHMLKLPQYINPFQAEKLAKLFSKV
ncbi:MAG: hypothetical protein J6I84_03930 [Bacilli bacterium]|nr:hypothetical protein [Bacilli bacterium]